MNDNSCSLGDNHLCKSYFFDLTKMSGQEIANFQIKYCELTNLSDGCQLSIHKEMFRNKFFKSKYKGIRTMIIIYLNSTADIPKKLNDFCSGNNFCPSCKIRNNFSLLHSQISILIVFVSF